jgi:hypothetical protein
MTTIQRMFDSAWIAAKAAFRWYPVVIIPILVTLMIAMVSIGPSLPSFHLAFPLAYFFAFCGALWSAGVWLTSKTLLNKKPNHRARLKTVRKYYFRMFAWLTVIAIAFVFAVLLTHAVEEQTELDQPGGLLIPANDLRPDNQCNVKMPQGTLAIYLGQSAVWFSEEPSLLFPPGALPAIVTKGGEVLLGIRKDQQNGLSLTSRIKDKDLRLLAEIDDNQFMVNRYSTFSMKRTDHSTLVVRDAMGDAVLNVRYLNPTAVRITGKLYFANNRAVEIGETTMTMDSNRINGCFAGSGVYVE